MAQQDDAKTLTQDKAKAPKRRRSHLSRAERDRRAARFPGGPEQVKAELRAARIAQQRAERVRVGALTRADALAAAPGPDHGPALPIERDRVEVRDALIPEDPDERSGPARRGRRAHRVWAPDRMLNKTIDAAQYQAAVRYLDDFEIGHEGARERRVALVTRDTGPAILGPSDRQIDALRRWQDATQRAGKLAETVLRWCVLRIVEDGESPTVQALAKRVGWSDDRVSGVLVGALSCLAAFYGTSNERDEAGGGRRRHTIAGHAGHGPEPEPVPSRPVPRRASEPHGRAVLALV